MEIVQTREGLVRFYATLPSEFSPRVEVFNPADWDPSGANLSISSNRLRVNTSGGSIQHFVECLTVDPASDFFVHAVIGQLTTGGGMGVCARIEDNDAGHALICYLPAGFVGTADARDVVGFSVAQSDGTGGLNYNRSSTHRVWGQSEGARLDIFDDASHQWTVPEVTRGAVLGRPGIFFSSGNSNNLYVHQFQVFRGRYLRMEGLTPGQRLQVWTGAGAMQFEAVADANGVAQIDYVGKAVSSQWFSWQIQVREEGGELVTALFPPEGVWPGDIYVLGEPPPPVDPPSEPASITSPALGQSVSASLSVAWEPATDPQDLPLTYEGDYWDGSEWLQLFPLQEGLAYLWDTSQLPERNDYRVRVRAHNGELYGDYTESDPFTVDHLGAPGAFTAPVAGTYFDETLAQWEAADPIGGIPPLYELEYAKDGGEWLPLTQTGDTSFPLALSDLEGSGEYQLRVRALSGEHESAWVESATFTLRSNVAPPTPEIITPEAGGRLGDTTRIEWDPVFDEDGDPVLYEGDYWDGSAWVPLFPMQEEASFEWDTSALAPGGGYRIRVRSFDGLLYSDYAEVANLRLPGFAPGCVAPAGSFEGVRPPFVYDRTSTYGDFLMTYDPLFYWRFEERVVGETGVPIRDSSGNGRHASWDGQPAQVGVPGAVCIRGARPGSGARVIGPPVGPWLLDPWAAFYGRQIFTAWVRFDDVVVRNVIASWPGTWTFYVENSRFYIAQSHGGSTYPDVPYGPGVALVTQIASRPLVEPDTWYFVAAYMDRGSARGFYVNGQSWGSSTGPGGSSSPPSGQPIQIGDSNGFRGVIDEVALFAFSTNEAVLSQIDLITMMNMGLAAVCTEGGSFVPCEVPVGLFEPCDDDGGGGVPI